MQNYDSAPSLADYVWVNGEFIAWEQARIHALTHSLHYASSVFEGIRAYNGQVYKIMEHVNRLLNSSQAIQMPVGFSAIEIKEAILTTLAKNNLTNAYIRPLIWRGASNLYIYHDQLDDYTNLMIMTLPSAGPELQPVKLWLSPWRKISNQAVPVQCKSAAHYSMVSAAKKKAHEQNCQEILMLDEYDYVAEAGTANIFFAKDDVIVTPIADRCFNGITRQTVIELAKNLGYRVHQQRINITDINNYDTCFLTGTAVAVTSVEAIILPESKVNFPNQQITKVIQQQYMNLVKAKK